MNFGDHRGLQWAAAQPERSACGVLLFGGEVQIPLRTSVNDACDISSAAQDRLAE
jgi:hypothetical protein